MELFQILSSTLVLGVFIYWAVNVVRNAYYIQEKDKYGRRHKRDVRNGRFVRVK